LLLPALSWGGRGPWPVIVLDGHVVAAVAPGDRTSLGIGHPFPWFPSHSGVPLWAPGSARPAHTPSSHVLPGRLRGTRSGKGAEQPCVMIKPKVFGFFGVQSLPGTLCLQWQDIGPMLIG